MKFRIHPLFILLFVVSLFAGFSLVFLNYIIVVLLHEFGHSYAASRLGYSLNNFVLLPQGAQVSGNQFFTRTSDEIKIALAGPLINIVLAFLTVSLWWLVPDIFAFSEMFVFCNVVTAIFNLLPIMPLDGGRVLIACCAHFKKRRLGIKICTYAAIIACLALLSVFVYSIFVSINFSYLIMAVFLFVPVLNNCDENVYIESHKIFNKIFKKNGTGKINSFAINKTETLGVLVKELVKSRFNVAYVIDENSGEVVANLFEGEIFEILQKHPLSKTLAEVL